MARLFADAVRLAINVSLKSKGMSLYTLHAISSVASRSPLFDLDSGRIQWAAISLVYFALFTIQTSAQVIFFIYLTADIADEAYQLVDINHSQTDVDTTAGLF